jgi:hypothetical protein
MYGALNATGTADFFPNGGVMMSGCAAFILDKNPINGMCNHMRAIDYFAESINHPFSFYSVAANSFNDYINGNIQKDNYAFMGIACSVKYA